ncbi:hypothetical protein [Streptomyces exfoliatus]|uniref:hypothetical protein n=1 Tax=Streptomyces exfoliatus TaxID=1905 RepID=UPI0037B06EAB
MLLTEALAVEGLCCSLAERRRLVPGVTRPAVDRCCEQISVCEGGSVGPSFVVERLEFLRDGIWRVRYFKSLVTFLVGHSNAGKSTALEVLLYPLGLTTATIMPEVRDCQQIRLTFRVAGTRWQATRKGAEPQARVLIKNLDDENDIGRPLPVTSTSGEITAGAFVQNLLGLPTASRGAARLTLDTLYGTVMALRQTTIASEFLGGGQDKARILVLEVILGLWSEALADLEKNASEAETQHRAAQTALNQFKKLRDSGALADPKTTLREYDRKQQEHKAAAERAQSTAAELSTAVGEHGRLVALHKAAEQHRRKTTKQAEDARTRLNRATADLARAEGVLSGLLSTPLAHCTGCSQELPQREPGQCRQCGQAQPDAEDRREKNLASTRAKIDRLRLDLTGLQEAASVAGQTAVTAEEAAAQALALRDTYERDHLAPARQTAQQAEKEAFGLSRDVAQLKKQIDNADYIKAQAQVITEAKERMKAAQAVRDAAKSADEVRRKEVTGRWTELFLKRLQQINPAVETAFIDPADFTTRVKERDEADKSFDDSSVGGNPKAVTNIALLLALRDLGRSDVQVRVPPLLIIDSPLSGLGSTGLDHETSLRLIDTLISVAADPATDGYGCQVIAATNDPLPRAYPGVREIHIDTANRFFDHAPPADD